MTDIGPGAMVRVKNFTAHVNDGALQLSYARPKGKKADGKYFCLLLLGVDNGDSDPQGVDPDAFLKSVGWTSPDDTAEIVSLLKSLERSGQYVEYADGDCWDECPECREGPAPSDPAEKMRHKDDCKLGAMLDRYI